MRIAFVTPRYGNTVVGGAERQVLEYAQRLSAFGHETVVLTTCTSDHATWENTLPSGDSIEHGVLVRRFPITRSPDADFVARCGAAMSRGFMPPRRVQDDLIMNTGYSEPLLSAIAECADDGFLLVFTPYLYSSTVHGAAVRPDRSIVIPCLHDEPFARFAQIQATLRRAAGLIFNTDAEAGLAERVLGTLPRHRTVGFGFDPPATTHPDDMRRLHHVDGPAVAYVGRREPGKNFPLVLEWMSAYDVALAPERPVSLLLMGAGEYTSPRHLRGHIVDLGWASPALKFDALAAATALVNLSRNESFSHVLAEAWLAGTPVIVHADCDVTREHCERSSGGLWVRTAEAFAEALIRLTVDGDLRRRLGDAGRRYVTSQYSWPVVLDRLLEALTALNPPLARAGAA